MNDEQITVSRTGAVATVVLNRPDSMNALRAAMWPMLGESFSRLSADDDIRCIVLKGAGAAFSLGADISEYKTERFDAAHAEAYGRKVEDALTAITSCRHPCIAAITGPCAGLGLVLAVLCDLRISGESGQFGISIGRLGLALSYPEFAALFGRLGRSLALELVLDARLIDAPEALAKGIVNRVVPDTELDQTVAQTADRIAQGPPLANRWHKAYADRLATGAGLGPEEISESYASYDTDDYRIGYQAYLCRRRPTFHGR